MIWISEDGIGSLVTDDEALVRVDNRGLMVGLGAFETLKVAQGIPLALTRHLNRLQRSLGILGMDVVKDDVLREAISEVLLAEGPHLGDLARARITVTDSGRAAPTIVVSASAMTPWPEETTACVVPWTRNENGVTTGAKTTSYVENAIALRWAQERGFSEAIFANTRGELCEGSTSNVFIVRDGAALTPALDSGCLPGITRELVREWCIADETALGIDELVTADEIFLTSSTRGVHPVTSMGERELAVGPITRRIRAEFLERERSEPDPA